MRLGDLLQGRFHVGTVWFGRPWPPGTPAFHLPSDAEIDAFLTAALELASAGHSPSPHPPPHPPIGQCLMLDTARAYGSAEARLGEALARLPAALTSRVLIASKWGGSYERELRGEVAFVPTLQQLQEDWLATRACLPRVDILYTHLPSSVPVAEALAALADDQVHARLAELKRAGDIRFTGASISHHDVLCHALDRGLLNRLDVLQLPVRVCRQDPELCARLTALVASHGITLVLNSPVRGIAEESPDQALQQAVRLCQELPAVLLSGSRHHLHASAASCSALLAVKPAV